MFIIRFQGGLGNQMFQYAFLCAMKYQYPKVKVKADLMAYNESRVHYGFELEKIFNIELDNLANRQEVIKLSYYVPSWKFCKKIFRITARIIAPFRNKIIKKSFIKQKDSLLFYKDFFKLNPASDYYIEGFWCNEKYFLQVRNKILNDFQFQDELYKEKETLLEQMKQQESVSIHVRRGDYVNSGFDMITLDYYKKAIKIILEKVKAPVFYVFSDDVEYVQKEFSFLANKQIISDNTDEKSYKDMFLMSQCKHNIVANSTFSYWGAYLNKNLNKIIIAPKIFNQVQTHSLACDNWIKIKN
jgi:hypothetical protein